MNRDKLLGLQLRLDTNTITNADALQWLINALLEDDDANSPETPDSSPRVDRSLRGLVLVEQQTGNKWAGWADDEGVRPDYERGPSFCDGWSWAELEADGASVRKLTLEDIGFRVRRWDEWTDDEKDDFILQSRKLYDARGTADRAVDIALRGTHE